MEMINIHHGANITLLQQIKQQVLFVLYNLKFQFEILAQYWPQKKSVYSVGTFDAIITAVSSTDKWREKFVLNSHTE